MVLDASAIVAVHLQETGHESLIETMESAPLLVIGVPTVLETAIVLSARLNEDARPLVLKFLRRLDVEIVSFETDHFQAAMDAFLRFGRGRHRAGLNFGDCMSYAIASVAELPLLYTGQDFAKTDITAA